MIYLDYAASAPLRPVARTKMLEIWDTNQGNGLNPSSLHVGGRGARELLEQARADIAECIGAAAPEVIFTAGGTEADALAVRGLWKEGGDVLAISAIEHAAISENAREGGRKLLVLPVTESGVLNLEKAQELLASENLGLVSVMAVNNEVGTIQPVLELTKWLALVHPGVPIHCDAVQGAGKVPLDFSASGLTAMSLAAHKVGGPTGVGALVLKKGVTLKSDRLGGGQERGVRSGTQSVAGAAGFAAALRQAVTEDHTQTEQYCEEMRRALRQIKGVKLTTSAPTAPGFVHFSVAGATSEGLLFGFDQQGICVSAGAACKAGVARPSNVLLAMGRSEDEAIGTVRVTPGWNTSESDVVTFIRALPGVIEIARKLGGRK
ncbi:MAG: cysteine desulfurase family protein [Actinomycetaceae bacterium]|nr:cysteine desulfurase family protein [Actinomycetaceae bacterium]